MVRGVGGASVPFNNAVIEFTRLAEAKEFREPKQLEIEMVEVSYKL